MNTLASVTAIIITGVCGCSAPRGPLVVTDPDPSVKIPAIKLAVDRHDAGAVKQLVADLDSDDPAIRFYAIEGLRKITGENFDYEFFDDQAQRAPAVKRWQEWLKKSNGEQAPTTQQ